MEDVGTLSGEFSVASWVLVVLEARDVSKVSFARGLWGEETARSTAASWAMEDWVSLADGLIGDTLVSAVRSPATVWQR